MFCILVMVEYGSRSREENICLAKSFILFIIIIIIIILILVEIVKIKLK